MPHLEFGTAVAMQGSVNPGRLLGCVLCLERLGAF